MKLDRTREALLDAEQVRELLDYDPQTGVFVWRRKTHKKSNRLVGIPAGCTHDRGYRMLTIRRKRYYAHRVAWLYMTGSWPEGIIDHRDRDPGNNKFENLYDATVSINGHNAGRHKRTQQPHKGVRKRGNNFSARIQVRGKSHYLGSFDSYEDAADAVKLARLRLEVLG